jgi:uncharacterized membrane protein
MRYFSTTRLADLWSEISTSYGLIPALMTLGSIGLAIGMTYLDQVLPTASQEHATWATALQAGAARTILSTLAGSMATIVGIVFSITIVALQLASSQFGPHLMRSFLTDRGSQVALGTLIGTFTYSLLVIVAIRGTVGFVPYASTYMGILIGIVSIGMLIYFMTHVVRLMRPESVIASRAREVAQAIAEVFPDHLGQGEAEERQEPPAAPPCFAHTARTIAAGESGYIRRIDDTGLMRLAQEHDLLIRLDVRPGDFIVAGAVLMAAGPADRLDDDAAQILQQTVVLGTQRTPDQDVPYALQHLEEVAIRSLSPGINAPYTAIPAIDQIGAALCRLAERRMPSPRRKDADGTLRVLVMRPHSFIEMARGSLGAIAGYTGGSPCVMARVIETVLLLADRARAEPDRRSLHDFAAVLAREGEAATTYPRGQHIVRAAFKRNGAEAAGAGRIA